MLLFIFEFLGTTELLVILVVALVIFGPRKLPELGRQLGKSLSEFKRASEDFKRTWEMEVERERAQIETSINDNLSTSDYATTYGAPSPPYMSETPETISRGAETTSPAGAETHPATETVGAATHAPASETPAPARKQDWL